MLLGSIYHKLAARLAPLSDTASLDAQVLLAHILDRSRPWVLAHPEAQLTEGELQAIEQAMRRLEKGEPLPYLLGHWEFYGLDFILTPDVLIPRPETELMVERALSWLRLNPARRLAADVGTGSGCIAVALSAHIPGLRLLASDISLPALKVALQNVKKHAPAGRVICLQADLLPATRQPFDLVCANLPYIPREKLPSLPVYRGEPSLALDGGQAGLVFIEKLLRQLPGRLAPGALVLLEIEAGRGEAVRSLVQSVLPMAQVSVHLDLAGQERLVEIQIG
jgi:release factor glutamine methyltransferase